jgi:hypothetical protein
MAQALSPLDGDRILHLLVVAEIGSRKLVLTRLGAALALPYKPLAMRVSISPSSR